MSAPDGRPSTAPGDKKTATPKAVEESSASASALTDVLAQPSAREGAPVPVELDLSASVPGTKFAGRIERNDDVTILVLDMRRAYNVIATSVIVNILIMGLALSLLGMVMQVTKTTRESTLLPLSMSVSLIFGLPALRNVQPDAPPLGALGDYVSFVLAEAIVAGCTIVVVWVWIVRSRASAAAHSHEPTGK